MRTADRIGAAILLVVAVAYTATAAGRYTYWTATGPGSGFFPFWLGLVLAALSALLLVSAARRPEPGPAWLPTGRGAVRLVVVVAVTAAFIALLPVLGMVLGTALFLGVLLRMLEGLVVFRVLEDDFERQPLDPAERLAGAVLAPCGKEHFPDFFPARVKHLSSSA